MQHGKRTRHVNFSPNNSAFTKQKLVLRSQCYVLRDRKLIKKGELRLHLCIFNNPFEKSHLHTIQMPMCWRKGVEVLLMTLQRHNKFLQKIENKKLLQVQSIGPYSMDGHHQWYTTDRLTTSSKQQTSHGMVAQLIKAIHVCHFLQSMKLQRICHKCFKELCLLIKFCWTYIVLWWQHNVS